MNDELFWQQEYDKALASGATDEQAITHADHMLVKERGWKMPEAPTERADGAGWIGAPRRRHDTIGRYVPHTQGAPRAVAQGASFGFSDEAIGAFRGAISPELSVGEGIDKERELLHGYRNSHPVAAGVAEGAGAVATSAGMMAPARAGARALGAASGGGGRLGEALGRMGGLTPAHVNRSRRLKSMATEGAAAGAVYGAGAAEGNPLERADNAVVGGLGGAAVGGVARGAAPVMRAFGPTTVVGAAAASQVDVLPAGWMQEPLEILAGGTLGFALDATAKRGMNLAARPMGAPRAGATRAAGIVDRALEREGGMSWEEFDRKGREAEVGNTLLDVAPDERLVSVARTAAQQPSGAHTDLARALEHREGTITGRALAEVRQRLAPDLEQSAYDAYKGMIRSRSERGRELYGKVDYSRVVDDPEVVSFLGDRNVQRAWKLADETARLRGELLPEIFEELPGGGVRLNTDALTVENLEIMQQYLRRLTDRWTEAGSGRTTTGLALADRLDGVLRRMEEADPALKVARRAWWEDSRKIEAFEFGQDVLKGGQTGLRWEDVRDRAASMDPEQRKWLRLGVVDAVERGLGDIGDSANPLLRISEKGNVRRKILHAFGEEDRAVGEDLFRRMQELSTQRERSRAYNEGTPFDAPGGGSDNPWSQTFRNITDGGLVGLPSGVARTMRRRADGYDRASSAVLGESLGADTPEARAQALDLLGQGRVWGQKVGRRRNALNRAAEGGLGGALSEYIDPWGER